MSDDFVFLPEDYHGSNKPRIDRDWDFSSVQSSYSAVTS